MVNTFYATDGKINVDILLASANTEFTLGERVSGNDGSVFVYCQANGAITGDGYVVLLDEDFQATMINLTNSASAFGQSVGVVKTAFADNEYGWVQLSGTANIRVSASAAANTALNSTGTGGQIDDNAGSGAEVIDRMILTTANGGSAGTAEGVLNFPTVGATL